MRPAILGGAVRARNNTLNNRENQDNATPTRPRSARPPLRPPLQSRDHNAMMRVPPKANAPLTSKSGNANMPSYDKHNGTRPLMPTLSASAKASNRTPLTPRVAGSAPLTLSTPLSRRGARSENNTPASSSREDLSTPVSTFLNNNITPRSGSRKSRVDSTNTTPTGTPNGTPVPPSTNESFRIAHDPPACGSGLGISGVDKDVQKRPTVSFSPAVSDIGYSKSSAQSGTGDPDSKFFFASDAKTTQSSRPPFQQKISTFFYANGDSIPPPPQSSSASAVGSAVGDERVPPKFFHANGTPDLQTSPSPHFPPPRPSSTVSTSSRMTSPRLAAGSPGTFSPPQRPASPSKLNQHASLSSLRNTPSLPSPILTRPGPLGRGQSATTIAAARRASIESAHRASSHGRSSSLGSSDIKGPPVGKLSGNSSVDGYGPATTFNPITTSVPVSTPEELSRDDVAKDDSISELQSPTKPGHSIEHMNELAANARRERKVLDLEITNSSLAAINRTLEREMRKQTTELRRYRRLSRSGRLSIATSGSMRTSNGSLSILEGAEGSTLSDMSEEESEDEEDSEFSDEESVDDGSLSPRAMAESDLRHRKKDEKRLQLDLSKHQQLLIDSQKMNQSLKRCLGWTEELISEGKKALEYHVRVSDVELGGRVLAPDEVEDGDNEGISDMGASLLKQARLAAASATWGGTGRDDGDSGIELDGAHREHVESAFTAQHNLMKQEGR